MPTSEEKWKEATRILARVVAYASSSSDVIENAKRPELHRGDAFADLMKKVHAARAELQEIAPDAFATEFLYPAQRA